MRGSLSASMDLPDEEKAVALTQELIRGATQAVRNWGYPHQIKRMGAGLKLSTSGMLESVNSGAQRGAGGHVGFIGTTFPTKCRIDAYDFG